MSIFNIGDYVSFLRSSDPKDIYSNNINLYRGIIIDVPNISTKKIRILYCLDSNDKKWKTKNFKIENPVVMDNSQLIHEGEYYGNEKITND